MTFKIIIAFERQENLSRQQCHDYLRKNHADLVMSIADFSKYVFGYVQNFADITPKPQVALNFQPDAVAELFFESFEKAGEAFSEPRYLEFIRPDEGKFANFSRLVCTGTQEHIVWDQAGKGASKLFRFLALCPGVEPVDVAALYKSHEERVFSSAHKGKDSVYRYVQSWPLAQAQAVFSTLVPVFCIEEFWLSDDMAQTAKISFMQELEDFQSLPDIVDIENSFVISAVEKNVVEPVSAALIQST